MLHQYVSGNFPTFSGTGPPEIAPPPRRQSGAAARANQSSNNNPYREPPLASDWKPIGDVAAMLVRRLSAARREPEFALQAKESPAWGRASKDEAVT